MKYLFLSIIIFFSFNSYSESNYDQFEKLSNQDSKEVKHIFKLPKINKGIIFSKKLIKSSLTFQMMKKNNYTLDLVVSNLIVGFSVNKIYTPIIDFKIGWFLAYSLDKDYRYNGWINGFTMSILKF